MSTVAEKDTASAATALERGREIIASSQDHTHAQCWFV